MLKGYGRAGRVLTSSCAQASSVDMRRPAKLPFAVAPTTLTHCRTLACRHAHQNTDSLGEMLPGTGRAHQAGSRLHDHGRTFAIEHSHGRHAGGEPTLHLARNRHREDRAFVSVTSSTLARRKNDGMRSIGCAVA